VKKWIIIAILVIAVIVVGYPLLFKGKKEPEKNAFTVTTQDVVKKGDLTISVSATGKIEPIRTVELRSKASGEIIRMLVEEGDLVKKGQVICELEQTTASNDYEQTRADLEVARVNLEIADKELERQQGLYAQKLISDQELEGSRLKYEQAKSQSVKAEANLSSAKERLDDTVIRSPMDGVMIKRYVEEGQVIASGISNVSGGTLIAVVGELNSVYIQADVDETDIGKVALGQPVKVIADAYPEKEFYGKVLRIAPMGAEVQNVTTFKVTAQVENPQKLLKAGMNANVEIVAADLKNVLLLPAEAVKEAGEVMQFMSVAKGNGQGQAAAKLPKMNLNPKQKYVLALKEGGPTPVPVEIGVSDFDFVELKSGLSEGDSVLTVSVSQMMQDREAWKERMRQWRQLPGVKKQ
jgi:HlyD family secretion protein